MKSLFIASLMAVCGLRAVASAEPITPTVYDVMAMSREEFVAKGLGTGSSYNAQRSAIQDGSAYLLSAVTAGNGDAITNGKMPASASASGSSGSSSSFSSWRRIGQYIGGGSELEEEEFFAETDRVFEKWAEAQQARKIREAKEKRKQAELERKRQEKSSKNGDQRDGTSEASSEDSQNEESSNKNGKANKNNNKNKDGSSSSSDAAAANNNKKVSLTLPASQISANDAKRRKLITSSNTTIEQKIKTVAADLRGVMKRLRATFIPQAAEEYKLSIKGKSATNADRHRQLMFKEFYDGPLPEALSNVSLAALLASSDVSDGSIDESLRSLADATMNRVLFDMLKYTSSTTAPATNNENSGNGDDADDKDGSSPAAASASSSSSSSLISAINPYTAYPRLYKVPIIDVEELLLLTDELRYLKASEATIERQFALIEKGNYEKDLALKIAALKNKDKESKAMKTSASTASTIAMIEANPREYYRSLRQHTMTPKVTEELATLANVINTNYNYQSQLIHSSYPLVVTVLLPRLRRNAAALKDRMRANDESTNELRKQLKEQNQLLKLISNDIAALNSLAIRMTKFRQNNAVDMLGYTSTLSSRTLLLPAADVTTLLLWANAERQSGAADSISVHPEEYARITRGDQPLLNGNGASDDDSSSSSADDEKASKRKARRNRRNKSGGDSDSANYLEGSDADVEFTRLPITEWLNITTFTFFGLSAAEFMTLLIAAFGLSLLVDVILDVPSLLVRHTIYLSTVLLPKLRRWAGGNRLRGPSTAGKAFLAVVQGHLFVVSLITNLHLKFGRVVLPLLGLYHCDLMEAYVQGGMQYARQTLLFVVRGLKSNGSTSAADLPAYQTFKEVQMAFRQRVPFTVWVMSDPSQLVALGGFLAVALGLLMAVLVSPAYKKANKRLDKTFASSSASAAAAAAAFRKEKLQ